jgi:hypothetical protein
METIIQTNIKDCHTKKCTKHADSFIGRQVHKQIRYKSSLFGNAIKHSSLNNQYAAGEVHYSALFSITKPSAPLVERNLIHVVE